MTMEPIEKQELMTQVDALGDLFDNQKIELDVYGKWAVKLAYDLMVGDELQQSVSAIVEVPDRYYREYQAQQMVDDPEFCHISEYLARRLQVHGFVPQEFEPNIISRIGIA